jgi:hypothetical protein
MLYVKGGGVSFFLYSSSSSVSQKTPWRGEMFYGFVSISTLIWGKKNILSLKERKEKRKEKYHFSFRRERLLRTHYR